MGRKLTLTPELAATICGELAEGKTLREVCRAEGMPPESTVRRWVVDDVNGFAAQYARARDELLEISDDGTNDWMRRQGEDGSDAWQANGEHLQRSRLRVDTRKWLLSKALPKVYGEKIGVEHSGAVEIKAVEVTFVGADPKASDR
jgi:hypothetical protein